MAFFPPETGGRLKIVVARLELTFRSSSTYISSMRFKSAVAQAKTSVEERTVPLYFNVPLAEFTCMFWIIILQEYKYLNLKPCPRWDHIMLQIALIVGVIQFTFQLVKIPDFANTHTVTELLLCFTECWSSYSNALLDIGPPTRAKDFELLFVNPMDFTPILYFPVFVNPYSLEAFETVLFL